MAETFSPRPLYLHTVESLCADLVSGRAISTGDEQELFCLDDDRARCALQWYQARALSAWTSQITAELAEGMVDAILSQPPGSVPVSPA